MRGSLEAVRYGEALVGAGPCFSEESPGSSRVLRGGRFFGAFLRVYPCALAPVDKLEGARPTVYDTRLLGLLGLHFRYLYASPGIGHRKTVKCPSVIICLVL